MIQTSFKSLSKVIQTSFKSHSSVVKKSFEIHSTILQQVLDIVRIYGYAYVARGMQGWLSVQLDCSGPASRFSFIACAEPGYRQTFTANLFGEWSRPPHRSHLHRWSGVFDSICIYACIMYHFYCYGDTSMLGCVHGCMYSGMQHTHNIHIQIHLYTASILLVSLCVVCLFFFELLYGSLQCVWARFPHWASRVQWDEQCNRMHRSQKNLRPIGCCSPFRLIMPSSWRHA